MIHYLNYISRLDKSVLVIIRFLIETILFIGVYIILFFNIPNLEGMDIKFHIANTLIWLFSYKIFGLNLERLRYASLLSYLPLLKVSLFMSAVISIERFIVSGNFDTILMFSFFLFLLNGLVGLRITARQLIRKNLSINRENIIVYGTKDTAVDFINSLTFSRKYNVVGVLVDVPTNAVTIAGLPIIGLQDVREFAAANKCRLVVLANDAEDTTDQRSLLKKLDNFGLSVSYVPTLDKAFDYEVKLKAVKPEDVLGRSSIVELDKSTISQISKKNIFITGAGGSIGSELCEQVLRYRPSRLVLLDSNELALYNLEQRLTKVCSEEAYNTEIAYCLGSCTDEVILEKLFRQTNIDIVYHAAAYKHVPIVEENVAVGLKNNIFGTNTVAQLAHDFNVKKFVLVSTDKAVRPTNVMGASKRFAELIIQDFARASETKFSIVRFGNVLGSSGSVIPKFKAQIDQGGPVTVTHPDVTRYFMSIPEAAHLVINAGTLSHGGEIFLLDMGDPVKIVDLARSMIRQHGLQPILMSELEGRYKKDSEVLITFSGLRPGEKLYEELLVDGIAEATTNPRIFKSAESQAFDLDINGATRRIKDLIETASIASILHELSELPLAYNANNGVVNIQNSKNEVYSQGAKPHDQENNLTQSGPSITVIDKANILQRIVRSKLFLGILHRYFLLIRGVTIGVRILVQNHDHEILLVKHTYLQNWYLPGGGVDRGEDIYTAALRELYEETGVSDCSELLVKSVLYNKSVSKKDHVVVLTGATRRKNVNFSSFEIASAGFFKIDTLPPDMDELSKKIIHDIMNNKPTETC